MGKSVIPSLERRSNAGDNTHCLWFPKGSPGGNQVVLVSDSRASGEAFFFVFLTHDGPSTSLQREIWTQVLADELRTQRRGEILNPDEKDKNNNQQFSDNLSTFSNLSSRLAGNNTQCILSDKTD